MYIDNNLGMALSSSSLSGTAPAGVPQDIVNGAAEGSLFQQMISQMLMRNQTAAAGETTGGVQGQFDGNGDMLSGLLLPGGSLAKLVLLDSGKAAEPAVNGQTDKTAENAEAVEMLQAMMAGLTGAVPVSKTETAISESQTVNSGFNQQIAAVGAALEMSVQQQYAASDLMQEGSLEGLENMAAAKSESPAEKAGLQTGRSLRTDGPQSDGIENTAATGEADFLQAAETESLKGEIRGSTAGAASAISGTGRMNSTEGDQALKAVADSAEKVNPKSETDGIDSESLGLRSPVQGAAAAGEATELNQTAQRVEANEPYSQIRNEILTKLDQKGPTEFKMQLQPEDLGQIDIKLTLSKGKLIIDIMAANARTHALLASQVDKLISSMGLQNVQIENVQISQQLNSQTQDSGQSQGFMMNSAMDFSQRKQQEQFLQQFAGSGKQNGSFEHSRSELQSGPAGRIESGPYGSYRMNYVV